MDDDVDTEETEPTAPEPTAQPTDVKRPQKDVEEGRGAGA